MTEPSQDLVPAEPEALVGEITDDRPIIYPPDNWQSIGSVPVMTNFDYSIDEEIAQRLITGDYWAAHSAWDFNGTVWHAEGRWHELVSVHHQAVASYSADTLHELMAMVNLVHGWR